MIRKNSVFLIAAAIAFAASATPAAELHVGPGRTYTTIQSAIDAAVDGDTVIVADGTWTGDGNRDIDFKGKAITVRSESGAEACVVDCEYASDFGFNFPALEEGDSALEGFTVLHARLCGIRCVDGSPTISGCVIAENGSQSGGYGGILLWKSACELIGCTIRDNFSVMAAIVYVDGGNVLMKDCIITGNRASGETIHLFGTTVQMVNCCVTKNNAMGSYGGVVTVLASSLSVHNSVITGNRFLEWLILVGGNSNVEMHNSIVWKNHYEGTRTNEYHWSIWGSMVLSHSVVEGGTSWIYYRPDADMQFGEGIMDVDPMLTNDHRHLLAGSPCIDAGDPGFDGSSVVTDIDGEARVFGGRVDIGPDEFIDSDVDTLPDWFETIASGSSTAAAVGGNPDGDSLLNDEEYKRGARPDKVSDVYVDPVDGDDGLSGLAAEFDGVDGPKRTIQAGIDVCENGQVILKQGTYRGAGNRDITFRGKTITVRSVDPADWEVVGATVVDCEGSAGALHRGFDFVDLEDEHSVLSGITITNGFHTEGGGIRAISSGPVVSRCRVINNVAGGSAVKMGGGIYHDGVAVMKIEECRIEGNSAAHGGGVWNEGNVEVLRCIVKENEASSLYPGAAIFGLNGKSRVIGCVISGNVGAGKGTAILSGELNRHEYEIRNCTIYGNGPADEAVSAAGEITNCILWDNGSGFADFDIAYTDQLSVRFCNIEKNWPNPGETNISMEPMFSRRTGRLLWGSPCIDAGDPSSVFGESALDLAGNPRVVYGRVDIGAYEITTADFDRNGSMDISDVAAFALHWLEGGCAEPEWCGGADLDIDGSVELDDFMKLARGWGTNDTGLKGYWRFGETSGSMAYDSSGYDHAGTLLNMDDSDWVEGKAGNALEFDGVDDYVRIEGWKGILGWASRTVCAWIRTDATDSADIVHWGDGRTNYTQWRFLAKGDVDGKLAVEIGIGYVIGTTNVCDGQWHHVAAVFEYKGSRNVAETRLYVDGVEDAISLSRGAGIDTMVYSDVLIGSSGGTYFDGLIDEVRIYDHALTDEEIAALAL